MQWNGKVREQAKVHQQRLSFLEGRLKSTELVLSEKTQLLPVTVDGEEDCKPNAPGTQGYRNVRRLCVGDPLPDHLWCLNISSTCSSRDS